MRILETSGADPGEQRELDWPAAYSLCSSLTNLFESEAVKRFAFNVTDEQVVRYSLIISARGSPPRPDVLMRVPKHALMDELAETRAICLHTAPQLS